MKKSKFLILSLTCCLLLTATLTGCKEKDVDTQVGTEVKEEIVPKTPIEKKQIMEELVRTTDEELNNILSIDDLTTYNKVGTISGGTDLYAFNTFSYKDLIERFDARMETTVLDQELYLRGFYVSVDNVLFTTDANFIEKQKRYLTDFSYFDEISQDELVRSIPQMEERIEELKGMGFENLTYYNVLFTADESAVEGQRAGHYYNVFYVLGTDKENNYRILDASFMIDGKIDYRQNRPHLSFRMIDDFHPNVFTKQTTVQSVEETAEQDLSEISEDVE